jgi:DNA-binding NarL/FixJ family response regulator
MTVIGPCPRDSAGAPTDSGCDDHHVGLTVVIVDDHPGFRRMARALLEADGFTVLGEAGDGDAAIGACERLDPDIVLLDVVLPGEDGFAVCARLSARALSRPAVVLTSTRPATAYTAQLRASACRAFVPKEQLTGAALRAIYEPDT